MLPFAASRLLRHSQGVFLLTSALSFLHQTADIVRQRPAVSAGGKPAWGQAKSQNSDILVVIFVRVQPYATSFQLSAFSGQPFALFGEQVPNSSHVVALLSITRYL